MEINWVSKLKEIRAKAHEDKKRKDNWERFKCCIDTETHKRFIDNLQFYAEECAYFEPSQCMTITIPNDNDIINLLRYKLNSFGFSEFYTDSFPGKHMSPGMEFCLRKTLSDRVMTVYLWVGETPEYTLSKISLNSSDEEF